jgi:hypothetical protein
VKKLAILVLLIGIAGCRRQAVVGSPPPGAATATGGATARDAVQRFMAAAKAQDLQALSMVWGTSSGPARSTMGQQELEMRIVSFLGCLRHDSYSVRSEGPATNGERVLLVELKFRELTRSSNFHATPGPSNRWYVRLFDQIALRDICTRRA